MIDLILVIIFCVMLFRMARAKGVSPLPYVLHYVILFTMMMLLLAQGLLYFYGPDIIKTVQGIKTQILFEPISLSFEVLLFIFLKKRIEKIEVHYEDENESSHPSTPNEKKDLSYFR